MDYADSASNATFAPSTQFLSNMAIVIGPTPPGTGVMYEAFCDASLKFTSPTSLYPLFEVASCNNNNSNNNTMTFNQCKK